MWFLRWSQLPIHALFLTLFLAIPVRVLGAQSNAQTQTVAQIPPAWNDAAARLASRIGNLAGMQKVLSLSVKNISSLTDSDATGITGALKAELVRLGFRLTDESATDCQVVLTLSEGQEGYVWVGQVQRGATQETTIVSVRKSDLSNLQRSSPVVSLQRKIVYEQAQRFTDFSVADVTSEGVVRMLVLEPTHLTSYHFVSARWQPAMNKILHPGAYPPRDPRGVISGVARQFSIYLPGESCITTVSDADSEIGCTSDIPSSPETQWPIEAGGTERGDADFQANRNYFDGMMTIYGDTDARLPGFFTAAALTTADDERWILAELDGKARFYHNSAKPSATFSGWGDDIATVVTGCAGEWQVLATGTGDWTQPDHIQTYEIRDQQAIKVGQPLDFPGPILALWPSTDMRSARVVSRNLQTGMYEASIVSVTCSE